LQDSQLDWPVFWHGWKGGSPRADGGQIGSYDAAWVKALGAFEPLSNRPEIEAPESLLYGEIGEIWQPIAEHDDWTAFEQKTVRLKASS